MACRLSALALATALALSACGENGGESSNTDKTKTVETPSRVTIGAVYDLTGSQSVYDILSVKGAELAVAQRNRGSGLLGGTVTLAVADGESVPARAAQETAALLAAHPKVSALFGLSDTDMVLAAARVAAEEGLLFVTSGATSPKLPAQVPKVLYLACFGDNVQAAAGAEWAYKSLGARKAAVLFNAAHSYTRLLHGYFQARFKELGGEIVQVSGYDAPDKAQDAIAALPQADLIYLAAETPPEAAALSQQIREAGNKAPILGGDGFDSIDVWHEHPALADIYFTTHAYLGPENTDPDVRAFVAAFRAANNGLQPDSFAALGYDAANLVMKAVDAAGSADAKAVLAAMADIRTFDGVTGTMYFAENSRIPKKTVALIAVKDGKLSLAARLLPEEVPAP